jgi:uncharacterized protein (DUF488 family)
VVDVRRHPGSRRHPHLARDALAVDLPGLGIAYEWQGEDLGGRRRRSPDSRHPAWRNDSFRGYADWTDSETYRRAVAALLDRPEPVAVMCAETVWWRCHRRLIADTASVRGATVVHLLDVGKTQAHPLHPALRPGEDGWPVWDVGATGELTF